MPVFTIEQAFRFAIEQLQAGRVQRALSLYRQLCNNPPPHAEGLLLLSALAGRLDLGQDQVQFAQRATALKPALANVAFQAGIIFNAMGQYEESIDAYRQAAQQLPHDAEPCHNLAVLLHQAGRLDEAIGAYRAALVRQPLFPEALSNLGNTLKEKGALDESLSVLQRAVSIRPNFAAAYNNLGNTFEQLDRRPDALAAFRRAVTLEPNLAEAHNNLGNALQRAGQFEAAMTEYTRAVELDPVYPEALVNLGNATKDTGDLGDAIELYRRAVAAKPRSWCESNLLLSLYYNPVLSPWQILEEHVRWARPVSTSAAPLRQPHPSSTNPARRLRIGYVSGDFRHHVVGYNLLPLFEHHDHERFEITCYSTAIRDDEITARFQSKVDHWHPAAKLNDSQLAQQIRGDGIDILVDLSLHTAAHRLAVFAQKPAPVQVTFAGYPGTTGLDEIDYRLTDPYLDPPGTQDSYYSEKSIRLAHSFWCYQPLSGESVVGPLPALSNGHIRFGCLSNFCKVNDGVLSLWSRVLLAVPGSRLLLMCRPGAGRERTIRFLLSNGVAANRVDFVDYQPRGQYLESYHRIDIGLDTFPYNGHTTSLDSFWMGVPVITLIGQWAVGRAGFSQLSNLGLAELAAPTPEQFIEIATMIAGDLPRLETLRRSLRSRMETSPLMDAKGFASDIEAAYRDMWNRWCASKKG